MQNLTENQQKVLEAVQNGATNTTDIAKQSGLAKSSVTAVVNSLVKKKLLQKSDDGTLSSYNTEAETSNPAPRTPQSVEGKVEGEVEGRPLRLSKGAIPLLIPYLKSEVAGEELRYALRSWEQNFKEDFQVVVIGDREDWFSPEIVHIPHEPPLVT